MRNLSSALHRSDLVTSLLSHFVGPNTVTSSLHHSVASCCAHLCSSAHAGCVCTVRLPANLSGATIQRLRLSRAVYLLTRSDASIVDIAGSVGFETSQAFAKALRRELGMSPSEVRERYVSHPQDLQLPTPRIAEHIPAISVEVIELEPFRVIALRNKGAYRELNLAYGRLFAWLAERADVSNVAGIWGVPHHDRRDDPASECIFDCYIATTTNVAPDHDVTGAMIGGGRFLVHRHVGSYDALDEAHDWLLRDVLPMRDLALRDAPILHRFLNDPDQVPDEQLETVIHVPVL